jgi:hypothetical protein
MRELCMPAACDSLVLFAIALPIAAQSLAITAELESRVG